MLKRRKSRPIEEQTIQRLFIACETLNERILLSLLINTGLRRSDLAQLRQDSFNLTDRLLIIAEQQKTKEPIFLPLPDQLIADLKIYLKSLDSKIWLFPSPYDEKKHIATTTINNMLKKIVVKAQVHNITPHDFRATFLTRAGKAGIPPKLIIEALGISYKTVMRYYQFFTLEEQREAFNKIQT